MIITNNSNDGNNNHNNYLARKSNTHCFLPKFLQRQVINETLYQYRDYTSHQIKKQELFCLMNKHKRGGKPPLLLYFTIFTKACQVSSGGKPILQTVKPAKPYLLTNSTFWQRLWVSSYQTSCLMPSSSIYVK